MKKLLYEKKGSEKVINHKDIGTLIILYGAVAGLVCIIFILLLLNNNISFAEIEQVNDNIETLPVKTSIIETFYNRGIFRGIKWILLILSKFICMNFGLLALLNYLSLSDDAIKDNRENMSFLFGLGEVGLCLSILSECFSAFSDYIEEKMDDFFKKDE